MSVVVNVGGMFRWDVDQLRLLLNKWIHKELTFVRDAMTKSISDETDTDMERHTTYTFIISIPSKRIGIYKSVYLLLVF